MFFVFRFFISKCWLWLRELVRCVVISPLDSSFTKIQILNSGMLNEDVELELELEHCVVILDPPPPLSVILHI